MGEGDRSAPAAGRIRSRAAGGETAARAGTEGCAEATLPWLKTLSCPRCSVEDDFHKPVTMPDPTEMFMSNDVYFALQQCGFRGAFMEGRAWQLAWQDSTHVFRHPGQNLALLARHHDLSDDVGYRFSNSSWSMWPLTPDRYAGWVRDCWGERVTLGWDFETFA